jgi:hypothetical protein
MAYNRLAPNPNVLALAQKAGQIGTGAVTGLLRGAVNIPTNFVKNFFSSHWHEMGADRLFGSRPFTTPISRILSSGHGLGHGQSHGGHGGSWGSGGGNMRALLPALDTLQDAVNNVAHFIKQNTTVLTNFAQATSQQLTALTNAVNATQPTAAQQTAAARRATPPTAPNAPTPPQTQKRGILGGIADWLTSGGLAKILLAGAGLSMLIQGLASPIIQMLKPVVKGLLTAVFGEEQVKKIGKWLHEGLFSSLDTKVKVIGGVLAAAFLNKLLFGIPGMAAKFGARIVGAITLGLGKIGWNRVLKPLTAAIASAFGANRFANWLRTPRAAPSPGRNPRARPGSRAGNRARARSGSRAGTATPRATPRPAAGTPPRLGGLGRVAGRVLGGLAVVGGAMDMYHALATPIEHPDNSTEGNKGGTGATPNAQTPADVQIRKDQAVDGMLGVSSVVTGLTTGIIMWAASKAHRTLLAAIDDPKVREQIEKGTTELGGEAGLSAGLDPSMIGKGFGEGGFWGYLKKVFTSPTQTPQVTPQPNDPAITRPPEPANSSREVVSRNAPAARQAPVIVNSGNQNVTNVQGGGGSGGGGGASSGGGVVGTATPSTNWFERALSGIDHIVNG